MVIGLDGASFNFIEPFCRSGIMPNLGNFWSKSCHGELISSSPPITGAAWTTFMTGKLAGKHHILDYEQFRFSDNSIKFNSSVDIRAKTLWRIISDHNLKVAVVNVPATYPPEKVNGVLIAGHNVPNASAEYTYPAEFKAELLKIMPDYQDVLFRPHKVTNDEVFEKEVASHLRTVEHYSEATKLVDNKIYWDFLMVVFPHTDMGHKLWPYMDPAVCDLYPQRRDRIREIFRKLDNALGDLFKLAERRGADVIIMSDHGHCRLTGSVRANKLLQRWGYIRMANPLWRLTKRIGHEIRKLYAKGRFQGPSRHVDEKLGINWSKTKAVVCHSAMWGILYINVRGRQPWGIVEPGAEYEKIRNELVERFTAAVDPATGEKLFADVIKAETAFGPNQTPWDCPDLLLVPQEGMVVNGRLRGKWMVKKTEPEKAGGTHLLKGLWMAGGPNINRVPGFEARIQDLTPTILTLLGLAVPEDMDGKVLKEIFKSQVKVRLSKADDSVIADRQGSTYTAEEENQFKKRLQGFGYF